MAVEVQQAAVRIRDTCLPDNKVGHEWISPDQWVQMSLIISFLGNATGIAGDLFVGTTNGTNVTVVNGGNLIENVADLELILTEIATVSRSSATEVETA